MFPCHNIITPTNTLTEGFGPRGQIIMSHVVIQWFFSGVTKSHFITENAGKNQGEVPNFSKIRARRPLRDDHRQLCRVRSGQVSLSRDLVDGARW